MYSSVLARLLRHRLLTCALLSTLLIGPVQAEDWIYTTRPGDTLWGISKTYLKKIGYYKQLQTLNNVDVAKRMAPGTRLRIPVEWLKSFAAPANILSSNGEVRYRNLESDQLRELADKTTAVIGDTLVTGSDASVLIQFADGSTLLLQSNSELSFDTLSSFEDTGMVDTRLRLKRGRSETRVSPLKNPDSRFEITTPAAVAAVRGTEFRVGYDGTEQRMSSEVLEGRIGVAAEGQEQSIDRGFGNTTRRGQAPGAPVKLLPVPRLDRLPEQIRQLPETWSWPTLDGAAAYRIAITYADQDAPLLVDQLSETAEFTLTDLDDGDYRISVRGIDAQGLQGRDSRHRFNIDTGLEQVQLIAPKAGQLISTQPLQLSWQAVDFTEQYRIQLSATADFSAPLIDTHSKDTSLIIDASLAAGHYYWRVAAVNNQQRQAEYSDAAEFELKPNNKTWLLLFFLLPAFI